MLIHYIHWLKY